MENVEIYDKKFFNKNGPTVDSYAKPIPSFRLVRSQKKKSFVPI